MAVKCQNTEWNGWKPVVGMSHIIVELQWLVDKSISQSKSKFISIILMNNWMFCLFFEVVMLKICFINMKICCFSLIFDCKWNRHFVLGEILTNRFWKYSLFTVLHCSTMDGSQWLTGRLAAIVKWIEVKLLTGMLNIMVGSQWLLKK